MIEMPTTTNGAGARDPSGRFLPGNPGGPGNPHARQVGRLRSAMLTAVDEGDLRLIVTKLVELAKAGNVIAAREVLDRCLGKPVEADLIERLGQLEALLEARPTR
jgi:hypothetical protein